MDADIKKVLLGIIGERIVASVLRNDYGYQVNESLDVFDSKKDMTVNGMSVEVKTQVPLLFKNSFTIKPNQLNKILNSYRVYWISVPPKMINDKNAGTIYEMNPMTDSLTYERWKTKSGNTMICFERNPNIMKPIAKIENQKLLKHLQELSTSYL